MLRFAKDHGILRCSFASITMIWTLVSALSNTVGKAVKTLDRISRRGDLYLGLSLAWVSG